MSAPTSRMTAGSFGKMPTTSERRLISRLSRSSGFVEAIWAQCSRGKLMYTSTSSREPSIRALTAVIQEAYIHGISTRAVDDLVVEHLCGRGPEPLVVIAASLGPRVEIEFRFVGE